MKLNPIVHKLLEARYQQSLQEGVVKNPETNKWDSVENIIRDILGEIKS